MKTKIFTLLLNKSLLSKLALIALLLIGGNSAWGDELTVYDETGTSIRVPFQGSYVTTSYYSANAQFIYPSSALSDMIGKRIDKLTFYGNTISDEYASWGDAEFTIYMMEVDKTAFASAAFDSWASMTAVYSGRVFSNARKMVIEMSTSFDYSGGNLLIGFERTQTGTSKAYNWFGKTQGTNTAVYQTYSASEEKASQEKFLPKITFTYYKSGTPSSFSISSITNSTATLNWAVSGSENKWQVAYSTDANFNPNNAVKVNVATNSCTLSNLSDGVKYYAYVRADYENETYSDWCGKLEFIPQGSVLLNDNDATSTYAPVNNNTKYGIKSQYVIKADKLSAFQNSLISEIVFYSKEYQINWTNATFDVYLNETDDYNTFTSYSVEFKEWGDKVCSAKTLSVKAGEMSIVFDTPFKYTDGNLIIGIQQTANTSASVTSTWYGTTESTEYTSAYESSSNGTSYSISSQKFSPKVKIISLSPTTPVTLGANGFTTFACPRPLDLTIANMPSGLKAYKATVDGTNVRFTEIDQTVPANTGVLLGGTPGETYQIPVAESGTAVDGNEFLVNSTGGTFAAESGYTYYALKKNSNPLTFAMFNPTTLQLPTNKAYLKVSNTAARSLTCWFDNETTGISSMSNEQSAFNSSTSTSIYNLQGQRVAQPQKGLYIVNGKKFINK